MIKKLIVIAVFSLMSSYAYSENFGYQIVAKSSATQFSVAATTTPTLLLSTGTGVIEPFKIGGFSFNSPNFSTNVVRGQYEPTRIHLEIFNDSGHTIHVGFDNQISSQAGAHYARPILTGTSWSHDCNLKDHYIVSGTTLTPTKIVVSQEW